VPAHFHDGIWDICLVLMVLFFASINKNGTFLVTTTTACELSLDFSKVNFGAEISCCLDSVTVVYFLVPLQFIVRNKCSFKMAVVNE
jgi:hypothetical protein